MNLFKKILKELPESKIEVVPDDPKDQEVANQMNQMIRHAKTNEQILDEMWFLDDQRKPINNLDEMIEMAKQSEYGYVWYSDRGPIRITKEGEVEPISTTLP
jgi:tRNA splicing ligase